MNAKFNKTPILDNSKPNRNNKRNGLQPNLSTRPPRTMIQLSFMVKFPSMVTIYFLYPTNKA